MKIIHITTGGAYTAALPTMESYHYGCWATPFAKNLLNYSDKYDIEVWKIYNPKAYGYHGVSCREKYGLTFKSFPSIKVGPVYFSMALLNELRTLIRNKERILVHLQDMHQIMPSLIAFFCKNIPLVAQQRGGSLPSSWKFRRGPISSSSDSNFSRPNFSSKIKYLILNFFEELSINNFDFVFACSIGETWYIRNKIGHNRAMLQKGGGFDFDNNRVMSKQHIRQKLGLPLDKKIMIHVGKFTRIKGVDKILKAFRELKKEFDLEMIFIGGNKTQQLYQEIVDSGAIVLSRMPNNEVLNYINASDLYLLPTSNESWIPFGGIGTAPLESLSLNVPVVMPMLIHFMGNKNERKFLGETSFGYENMIASIKKVLNNPENYSNARETVKKYYSWEHIIVNNTIPKYDQLEKEYY